MKILGICGTHKRGKVKSSSEWFLKVALEAAQEKGAEIESIRLIHHTIIPCTACNRCFCGQSCPLLENSKDETKIIFDKMDEADAFIFSSPVYAYKIPAVVLNFIQRTRPLHEKERAAIWGTEITAYKNNPFRGKAVGNLAVGAGLGLEGALFDLFHYLKAMTATSVACAGIALYESEIKNLCMVEGKFAMKHEIMKEYLDRDIPSYEENENAIAMARAVGRQVFDIASSELFKNVAEILRF
jgi:multimeric flavodoxin WrbA